jgi:hypothetical protein
MSSQTTLFLQRADESRTQLHQKTFHPVAEVTPRADAKAFQGWILDPVKKDAYVSTQAWNKPVSFILDFGEHIVGHFSFTVISEGVVDSPVRVRMTFGEVPSEVCEPFDPFPGTLSRGWLQDETFNVVPTESIAIKRRLAFRYVKVETIGSTSHFPVRFADFTCVATTSADYSKLVPYAGPEEFREIDAVAVRTLANCMQDVFEDGPKRDQRLWLGDLRVMALTNEVTFKDYGLTRRCLYLLAAYAPEDRLMPSDTYVVPKSSTGATTIFDYAMLFAATLLEYAKASEDWDAARELLPIAKRQMDLVRKRHFDENGLFVHAKPYWNFIDWRDGLDKATAVQGIAIYAMKSLMELSEKLGTQKEIPDAVEWKKKLTASTLKLRDAETGLFVSGQKKELSWASNIWMILAGVVSPEEGAGLLRQLSARKDAVMPAGPYLYHYVVDAMVHCGMKQEALDLMRRFWGGMVEKGASTFWEVYDPENDHLSPYKDHHMNSYCHAWSCTPSYFLRKFF